MRLSYAVCLGSLALISHSYILDSGCIPYQNLITRGMKSAFDLAQAGSDLLGSPSRDRNIFQAQYDLTTFMFLATLNDQASKTIVADKFNAVLQYNTNGGSPEPTLDPDYNRATYSTLGGDKIVIFCDSKRFTPDVACSSSETPGIACDTLMQYNINMEAAYFDCFTPSASPIQAWTRRRDGQNNNQAGVLQLCPWYLEEMQHARYKIVPDLGTGGAMALSTAMLPHADPGKTAMDMMDLFDFVLLHELTHAIHYPLSTYDAGYGWLTCAYLSQQGEIENADNYALFGLGARMISPLPNNGATAERPMRDGSIQILRPYRNTPKRNTDGYLQPLRRRNSNITLEVNNETFSSTNSNMSGFVVSIPSASPVTVTSGRAYTIGTDVISLEHSAIVFDHSTVAFPAIPTSVTTSTSGTLRSYRNSSIASQSRPSTLSTLTSARRQNYSSVVSSSFRSQSSLNSTRGWFSSSTSSSLSRSFLSNATSSLSSGSKGFTTKSQTSKSSQTGLTSSRSGTGSRSISSSVNGLSSSSSIGNGSSSASISVSASASASSNSIPVIGILPLPTATGSSSTGASKSSLSAIGSWTDEPTPTTPVSFIWVDVPTGTIASAAAETSEAVLLGGLFLALKANRKGLTDPTAKSQYLEDVKRTQSETAALLNDLSVKPPETPDCSNTKRKRNGAMRLSERQVRSILRDRSIISSIGNVITGAIHDVGTLLSCAENVIKSIYTAVNKDKPDLDEIEDLTDTLAKIGEDLKDDGDDDNNKSSSAKQSSEASKTQSSTSQSPTSSSSSSSSSCSVRTASACKTSYSIFTPTGATTASTSTITLSCSTVTACSASITGSSTTANNSQVLTASIIGDDFGPSAWLSQQQSILAAIMADTTDPRVTWSPNATSTQSFRGSISASSILTTSTNSSRSMSTTRAISATASATSAKSTVSSKSTLSPSTVSASVSKSPSSSERPSSSESSSGSLSSSGTITSPGTIISSSSVPHSTNPFPFTTSLLGGQVEACESSTTTHIAGYTLTMCAGSITTLVSATTAISIPTPFPTCSVWSDCPADFCSPKGQQGCDDDGKCRDCLNNKCICITEAT